MAVATLKKLWKNEYVQTAIMVALMLGIVFGFWYGVQWGLHTEHPALAVASTSMLPTLNVGDLIIVQGTPPSQIYANYLDGDIIVFRRPNNPDELIVHRAVGSENRSDGYWFTTKGDNNYGNDPTKVHERYLIGKVVGRIPHLGNLALLMHTRENMYVFTAIIIIIIVLFLTFPFESDKKEKTDEKKRTWRDWKLFGKISLKMIYLLIVNVLIVVFIVLNLWGAFTFWQPGANPPQGVTIRGMFPDVRFHESFNASHNNVQQVFLIHGFLTYTIDCNASDTEHEGLRKGVPTLSWAQAAIILLIILDVWEVIKFLKQRKTAKTVAQT